MGFGGRQVIRALSVFDSLRHWARRRHDSGDRALGARGEDLAHRYLQREGLIIVARNYQTRSRTAEVDIVAQDGAALVFVEVKTRATDEHHSALRAITHEKQERIRWAAGEYAHRAGVPWSQVRFDVVTVIGDPPVITHLRDAIEG